MLIKSLFKISLLAIFGTLVLFIPLEVKSDSSGKNPEKLSMKTALLAQLQLPELESIAQAITVKVHVGEYRGSGILIKRDNNTYTVITNAHLIERDDTVSIETSDGIKYTATRISKDGSETFYDLTLLQFKSSNNYQIAKVGDSNNLTEGETVIAAGFPFNADNLNITTGKISLLPDKSLQGGYQIGFTK